MQILDQADCNFNMNDNYLLIFITLLFRLIASVRLNFMTGCNLQGRFPCNCNKETEEKRLKCLQSDIHIASECSSVVIDYVLASNPAVYVFFTT